MPTPLPRRRGLSAIIPLLVAVALVGASCAAGLSPGAHAKAPQGDVSVTLNDRIVDLNGGIAMGMIKAAQKKMLEYESQSDAPIWVRINSGGGSVEAGLILIDTMRAIKSPVKCIVESKAYSMAAIILVFCAERYALPHSTIMLHEASYGTAGEDPQNRSRLDFLTRYLDRMHVEIAEAIDWPLKKYRARIRDAWWILADEAKKAGVIDGIIGAMAYRPAPVARTEQKDTFVEKSEAQTVLDSQPAIPKRR